MTDAEIEAALEKATPPPWSVGPENAVRYARTEGKSRIIDWIAECVQSGARPAHEKFANARLIAMAPALARLALDRGKEIERLREIDQENTRLRAALAMSKSPCVYCSLPAEQWAECCSGFPGCARADDSMGCPELGASLTAKELGEEVERLRAENAEIGRLIAAKDAEIERHRKAAREINLRAMARHDAWLLGGGNDEGLCGEADGLHEAAQIAAKAMEGNDD